MSFFCSNPTYGQNSAREATSPAFLDCQNVHAHKQANTFRKEVQNPLYEDVCVLKEFGRWTWIGGRRTKPEGGEKWVNMSQQQLVYVW